MARDEFSVRQLVEQHKKRGEIAEGHPTEASLCVLFLQKDERDLQVAASNFEMGAKEKSPVLQWRSVEGVGEREKPINL